MSRKIKTTQTFTALTTFILILTIVLVASISFVLGWYSRGTVAQEDSAFTTNIIN